jgi:hypothetical protein
VTSLPKSRNLWADIYLKTLSLNENDADELIALGLAWLADNPNLNRWKNVWDAIGARIKTSNTGRPDRLISLARAWLERAYPDIHIWPEVMIAVIEGGSVNEDEISLAKRWLKGHEQRANDRNYQKLAYLIENRQPIHSSETEAKADE